MRAGWEVSLVEIVVRGRHTPLPELLREQITAKLARLERFDHALLRVEAEFSREPAVSRIDLRHRAEITCHRRGIVLRVEACGADVLASFDAALDKLEERLRRLADRRHSRGSRLARGAVPVAVGGGVDPADRTGSPG